MKAVVVIAVLVVLVAAGLWLGGRGEKSAGQASPRTPPSEVGPIAAAAAPVPSAADPVSMALAAARSRMARGEEARALHDLDALLTSLGDGPERERVACELAAHLNNRAQRVLAADPRTADRDLRRAVRLCTSAPLLQRNLARMLTARAAAEARGDTEARTRARRDLEEALTFADEADAHALLGELLVLDDELDSAAEHLRTAAILREGDERLAARAAEVEMRAGVEGGFRGNRHQHFVARFEGEAQEQLAWTALDLLEHAYFAIGNQLGVHPKEPVTVVIYTGDQYQQVVAVPDWSAGAFDGKIRLRAGTLLAAEGQLERVLRHEYTHALLATLPARLPAWWNEGLAEHFEGTNGADARSFAARERARGHVASWSVLSGASLVGVQSGDEARLAYATAAALVADLVARGGQGALQTLCSRLAAGEDFDAAFTATHGLSPQRHYDTWLDSL